MSRDLHLDDGTRVGQLDVEAVCSDGGEQPVTSPTDTIDLERWRIVDVSNHGFDGSGESGCLAEFIADHAGRVAFVLPEGTYRWTRILRFTGADGEYDEPIPDRFALIGQPEATIEVDIDPDENPMHRTLFRFGGRNAPVPEVALKNLHVDVGDADPDRDAGICRATIRDRMVAENLSMTQRCRLNPDGSRNGDRFSYKVDVVSPSGVATHRDIDLTAGDVHHEDVAAVGHAIPFASEPNHEGVNRWIGCRVAGYTDNGFYVRNYSETGRNVLEGCLARNCGGGHIRVGRNDAVRSCKIVVDGTETPANGCGLWVENAAGTVVDGVRIEAPAMDNDMVRTTGYHDGAAIRNIYAELGDSGQMALKARGGYTVGHLACEGWTVYDECDGRTREASYSIDQPNVSFRDLTHHGSGGRIPFACREHGFSVEDSTITLNDTQLGRLGSLTSSGRIVDATFEKVAVIDLGEQNRAFGVHNDPELKRLSIKDCDFSRASFGRLFDDTMLDDFEVAYIRDTVGW